MLYKGSRIRKLTRIAVIDTLDYKLVLNDIQCKMFY